MSKLGEEIKRYLIATAQSQEPGHSPRALDAVTLQALYDAARKNATGCTHGLDFADWNEDVAMNMSSYEVRRRWPRFSGTCWRCGFQGTWYYSFAHYVAGDW